MIIGFPSLLNISKLNFGNKRTTYILMVWKKVLFGIGHLKNN